MSTQAMVRAERRSKTEYVGVGLNINLQRLKGLGIKLPSAVEKYSPDSRPVNPALKTVLSLVNLRRCRSAAEAVETLNQALVAAAIGNRDWPFRKAILTKEDATDAGYKYKLTFRDQPSLFFVSGHLESKGTRKA
jgi:hypothetical protein